MALFYVKNDAPFIPEKINPELSRLAKAIVKTCRLSFKHQLKTTGINNAMKSGDTLQMHDMLQKVLENQAVLKQPVVRNGSKATVGYQPEVWKSWEQEEKQ